ncbi:MAG TPA: class I SAM-dependent methyltransferase [Streptosporangiaceae bacterium]
MSVAIADSTRGAGTWAADLLREWDRQQALYRPHREGGLAVLATTAEAVLGGRDGVVVELGCGCGSVLARLRGRLPAVTLVGVDRDPVLLRIAAEVFSGDGRVLLIDGDLRDLDLADRLPGGTADVIVSCTTLHWVDGPELASIYRAACDLLAPGGAFVNLDWMPRSRGEMYRQAADAEMAVGLTQAESAGALSWQQWWQLAVARPELSDAVRRRDELSYERSAEFMPESGWHEQRLLDAGFAEAAEIWRAFDSAAVLAIKR